jgi:cyclophilin family peptidyl-prolyl cis-trans isomerase/HEAT repeat protein
VACAALAAGLAGCSRPAGPDPIRLAEDLRAADSPELIQTLGDAAAPTGRRVLAARAMGRIQSEAYAPALAAAAAGDDDDVRRAALFALGQLGMPRGATPAPEAVEAVTRGLSAPDPGTVAAAVEALGKLAPPGAAERILPLLGHDDAAVRREGALALFRLRFVPQWRGESEQPPELPEAAVQGLIGAFGDAEAEVRRAAVYAFSRFGAPGHTEAVAGLLSDPDEWVRLFAVRTLGRSGESEPVAALAATLEDESPRVRAATVDAIRRLDPSFAWSPGLASDASLHVRAALATALGGSTDEAGLEALRALETDAATTVRAAALGALAQRLGTDYAASLERYRQGDHPWTIRAAAVRAATHTGEPGVALIEAATADADPRVATAALSSLPAEVGDEHVVAALASDDLAVRGTAVSVWASRDRPDELARLGEAYAASAGEPWIEIRESIADAVGELEGADALLTRMLEDPAPSVRVRAHQALVARGAEIPAVDPPAMEPSPHLETTFDEDPVVVLETSKGEIEIRCLPRRAPIHVANFVQHVRQGFYDGLSWHRVVPNFVIQGGDPRGDGWGSAGPTLRDEISPERYVRGAVGMPKAGKDTGSCQIFITHIPTPHLDGNYTVFGRVTAGLDVVDRIEVGDTIVRARLK